MNRRSFIKTATALSAAPLFSSLHTATATAGTLAGAAQHTAQNPGAGGCAPVKIAQLGTTHEHAGGKLSSLRLHPDVFAIVGVVNDDHSKAARYNSQIKNERGKYKGVRWITEEEMFAIPDLGAVVVETANLDLVPAARRCLARGLPIHMDKPGGEDADFAAFSQMRREYEKRKLPFQMGYMFRGNPAMQWIQQAAAKGWLGEIFEIQASMSHGSGDVYQDYIANFRGGTMFNLGCHFIDFVVPLLGRPEKVVPFLKAAPGDSPKVRNNCLAILDYPSATATLRTCSREAGGRRYLKVCGTKGTVDLRPLERFDKKPLQMSLILKEGNEEYKAGAHTLDFGPVRDRYDAQLLEFAREVRGETKPPSTHDARHDILVQEILLAASGYTKWT